MVLGGVAMPAWWVSRNATTSEPGAGRGADPAAYPETAPTPATAAPAPVQPSSLRRENPVAIPLPLRSTRPSDPRQDVTTPATWLTGSPSASTASVIFLMSSGVRSV